MSTERTALVTAASGLLGTHLLGELRDRGILVLAHYYSHALPAEERVHPLQGDLSALKGVERFWLEHKAALCEVDYFFSNYGPLAEKKTENVEYEDMEREFAAHLAPLIFLTRRMREQGRLCGVMGSSIRELASHRGYRTILAHACAKGSMELVLKSWQGVWSDFLACSWPIPSLAGARFPRAGVPGSDPRLVARAMVDRMLSAKGAE